mgnify:CR=1 FL=1
MLEEILQILKENANVKYKAIYERQGIKGEILGVPKAVIRKLGNDIKQDHKLALELWNTNIYDAQILAIMLFDNTQFTLEEIKELILSTSSIVVLDELTLTIFENLYPRIDILDAWKHEKNVYLLRSAWNAAIANVITKVYTPHHFEALLSNIEKKLLKADPLVQYAMNRTLVEIGVRYDEYTDRCIQMGETLGLYKDMKVAKGCTSAYAPDWISGAKNNRIRNKKTVSE